MYVHIYVCVFSICLCGVDICTHVHMYMSLSVRDSLFTVFSTCGTPYVVIDVSVYGCMWVKRMSKYVCTV